MADKATIVGMTMAKDKKREFQQEKLLLLQLDGLVWALNYYKDIQK